jgi:DNA modification methylase
MFNDSFTDEQWDELLSGFIANAWAFMKEDSVAYICLDWRRNHEIVKHIDTVFKRSNLIVWDKVVHGLGSDYKYTHEFINVCKKGKPKLTTNQNEDKEYSDVWHIQRKTGKDEEHATKKPIELILRPIRHASKKNDLVLDLFGGSGSTLVACEKSGRRCYMMELSPSYVDVIVARWEKLTGEKAVLEKV